MPPLGLSVNGDRGQGKDTELEGGGGRRGWGRAERTACGSQERTHKPMMRHYSSMLLQGLARKPGALFIISFFPFYGTVVALSALHCLLVYEQ